MVKPALFYSAACLHQNKTACFLGYNFAMNVLSASDKTSFDSIEKSFIPLRVFLSKN